MMIMAHLTTTSLSARVGIAIRDEILFGRVSEPKLSVYTKERGVGPERAESNSKVSFCLVPRIAVARPI